MYRKSVPTIQLLTPILQITITASLFLSNTFLIIIKIYWYLLDWTVSYFDKSIFSSVISYMLDSNIYGKKMNLTMIPFPKCFGNPLTSWFFPIITWE